jgi:hypothetical protein
MARMNPHTTFTIELRCQSCGLCTHRREIDGLLDVNFATLFKLDHAGIFQFDRILPVHPRLRVEASWPFITHAMFKGAFVKAGFQKNMRHGPWQFRRVATRVVTGTGSAKAC